uniref:Uncharacterized protein n=1 Tax=Romanomermis culicivorax TaxID=13658 RepID=A0A915JQ89_ROMCU
MQSNPDHGHNHGPLTLSVGDEQRRQWKRTTSASRRKTEKSMTIMRANKRDDLDDENDEYNTKSGVTFEEAKAATTTDE